jgi:hypothetical protein
MDDSSDEHPSFQSSEQSPLDLGIPPITEDMSMREVYQVLLFLKLRTTLTDF